MPKRLAILQNVVIPSGKRCESRIANVSSKVDHVEQIPIQKMVALQCAVVEKLLNSQSHRVHGANDVSANTITCEHDELHAYGRGSNGSDCCPAS